MLPSIVIEPHCLGAESATSNYLNQNCRYVNWTPATYFNNILVKIQSKKKIEIHNVKYFAHASLCLYTAQVY